MSEHEKTEQEEVREEIFKSIKELDSVSNKFKTIALNFHLEKKKALDAELEKEMKILTQKYDKLSAPIYEQSQDIINGNRAVTEEELKDMGEVLTEEEKKQLDTQKDNKDAIQGYWLKAFKNCDMIAPEIREKDDEILEKLTKIEYIPEEDQLKFKLVFHFAENEFFGNETLTKHFVLKDEDEPETAEGTDINWKEGKNITVKTVKKTQKNKKSGAKRVVTKEVADESFFNFFKDSTNNEEGDEEDEEAMEANERIAIDFDISRGLIDEVIPYSLEYYLGVKTAEDYDQYGDDMEDCDEEDCEEDADCCKKPKKKAHKKSSDSTKSKDSKGEKPECKQQ